MDLYSITSSSINNGVAATIACQTNTPSPVDQTRNSVFETKDKVTLSQEGKDQAALASSSGSPFAAHHSTTSQGVENMNQQELEQLRKLKQRDSEVRTHEQAHLSAAGQYATGGPSFTYQKGPDGSSYAIGGEVGIDVSEESTPEATITKMQAVKRAALAPANPSAADKQIAARAAGMENKARQELLQQQEELLRGEIEESSPSGRQADGGNKVLKIAQSSSTGLKAKLATYEKMAQA